MLTTFERTVADMAVKQGLTNAEIAEKLGKTESNVAVALNRAVRKAGGQTHRDGYVKLYKMLDAQPVT